MSGESDKVYNSIYIFHIIIFVVLLSVITGCKVKDLVRKTNEDYVNVEQIIKVNKANEERVERVWIKKIKGIYSLENEEFNFNSNIRIIRDSIIIVSIATDFGIEAIRIYIKKDSLIVINRFQKTWYSGSISDYWHKTELNFDFDFLEKTLLMGIGDTLLSEMKENLKWKRVDSNYCYNWSSNEKTQRESICFDHNTGYLMMRTIAVDGDNLKFRIEYSGYEERNKYVLPTEINARLSLKSSEHKILLYYEKWLVNESFPAKVKISKSYQRVDRIIDL